MAEYIIIAIFVLGYVAIALEHKIKVNKASIALIVGVVCWVIYITMAPQAAAEVDLRGFEAFLQDNASLQGLSFVQQCRAFITQHQVLVTIGEVSQTLFFLIGAMTIVEVIDIHGGFGIITNRITARRKTTLLWVVSLVTFFLSALLDNMTSTIVMVMLVRRIIANYKERWVFASVIIIAANSGGAWSPIGDITTIMLWVSGNITAMGVVPVLILPCLSACLLPTFIASRFLHGMVTRHCDMGISEHSVRIVSKRERVSLSLLSVLCLLGVPVFKGFSGLPPFMGMLLALGVVWLYTEVMYSRKVGVPESMKHRVPMVLREIDTPTILFFLGILLSVGALQRVGVLPMLAEFLDSSLRDVYLISVLVGLVSAVVDNVPIVAAVIAMYPVVDGLGGGYLANFVQDGLFWQLLAYCSGVGGSVLLVGSVSGVVVMGLERIDFMWYVRHISLLALAGYLLGVGVFALQSLLF